MLGHESEGSVLFLLKDLGWATALSSGTCSSYMSSETFNCSIRLTDEGFKHWKDVVSIVYAYLGMLRSQEPSLDRFNELKIMSELDYDYVPRLSPVETVRGFSLSLARGSPLDFFVSQDYLHFDFAPEEIKKYLDYLTPNNSLTLLASKDLEPVCTSTERWYQARYGAATPVSEDVLQLWLSAFKYDLTASGLAGLQLEKLHIPDPNPFIPTREGCVSLAVPDEDANATAPERVYDDEQCTCFWKQDRTFGPPTVIGNILLANNCVCSSIHHFCCATVFKNIFMHAINSFGYMASVASTEAALGTNTRGLKISFTGFSEKIGVLLKLVVEELKRFVPSQQLFDMVKEGLLQQVSASRNENPYSMAIALCSFHECQYYPFSNIVLEEEYKKLTLDDLKEWFASFNKTGIRILSFFQGNLLREKAIELTQLVARTLSLPVVAPENIIQNGSRAFAPGETKVDVARYGEDVNNVSVVSIMNDIHRDERYTVDTVYSSLIKSCINPLFFDELRTKQQLGYVAWHMNSISFYFNITRFLIQSNTHDPDYITDRINEFRAKIPEYLEKITEEEFADLVKSYITRINIKDTTLKDNEEYNWSSIICGNLHFFEERELTALAKQCTREGMIEFAKKHLVPDAPDKHEFILQIWGKFQKQSDADEAGKKIVLSDIKDLLSHPIFSDVIEIPHKVLQPEKCHPPA